MSQGNRERSCYSSSAGVSSGGMVAPTSMLKAISLRFLKVKAFEKRSGYLNMKLLNGIRLKG